MSLCIGSQKKYKKRSFCDRKFGLTLVNKDIFLYNDSKGQDRKSILFEHDREQMAGENLYGRIIEDGPGTAFLNN